jgi:hypothetical protein
MSNERRGCNPLSWPKELVLYIKSLRNPLEVITKADLADDEIALREYEEALEAKLKSENSQIGYGHGAALLEALESTRRQIDSNNSEN